MNKDSQETKSVPTIQPRSSDSSPDTFNLSECIDRSIGYPFIPAQDVKEFIKRDKQGQQEDLREIASIGCDCPECAFLKDRVLKIIHDRILEKDKLAGPNLV